jgi:hypothetical protein
MRRFALRCLVTGHQDLMQWERARVYLACVECGRETRGWDLSCRSGLAPSEIASPSEQREQTIIGCTGREAY